MKLFKPFFVLFLFTIILSSTSRAQISLVPANHPVYEWLHHQRVLGNAPSYNYEVLPLSRGEISTILSDIEEGELGYFDRKQYVAYSKEFDLDYQIENSPNDLLKTDDRSVSTILKKKVSHYLSDEESHLFSYNDSISNVVLDAWWGYGNIVNESGGVTTQGIHDFKGFRGYGSLYNLIGLHLEYQNFTELGSERAVQYHPVFGDTFFILQGKSSGSYTQSFASLAYGKLRFDIGRGSLKYGLGVDQSLILSRQAPDFDWMRLNWNSKYLKVSYMHGSIQSLGTENETITVNDEDFLSRVTTPRWIVLRRFELLPFSWISMIYTQTVIYSNRSLDFSHLNPLYLVDVAEENNQDRDNPGINFEGIIRPFKSVELYAGLGMDDINKVSDVFKKTGNRSSEDAVLSYQAGISTSYKTGTSVNLEYFRIEPYYYTHIFRFNTYENFNQSLGHDLGPNSDQAMIKIRQWLPKRAWVELALKRIRKGLNVVDENGVLVQDVGGDIFEPQGGGDVVRFLSGDVHHINEIEVKAQFEPVRAFIINFEFNKSDISKGLQLSDRDYFSVGIQIGY
ncbi:MAG: hypothetical protein ED557_08525 [Balneola sp.]|nr:MAG: hypothetical protein ED557_08525 [Balneola sp.]